MFNPDQCNSVIMKFESNLLIYNLLFEVTLSILNNIIFVLKIKILSW